MKKPIRSLFVAGVLSTLCSLPAYATVLEFDLNFNFGAEDAGGNVLVTITEAATAGDVHITVVNNTLGFINDLFLNYDPIGDIASASVYNFDDGSGTVTAPSIQYNALQGFAIDFGYSTANDPNRFNPGETVNFDLTATADLLVSSFNTLGGAPTGDDYYAAAHVNGVLLHGTCGGGSAKLGDANGGNVAGGGLEYDCGSTDVTDVTDVTVPEPGSVFLLGLGLLGLGIARRRMH